MDTEPDTEDNTNPELSWRLDYLDTKARLSKRDIELLRNGPQSFSQALYLGVLRRRWEKMKGIYEEPQEPPNCQSSFKDFNIRVIEQYESTYYETS